jgi:hydrogenase nickel incorporation protein HypA/HybF
MHEMSIAQSLIAIIKEEMLKYDAKILRSVHLHIGEISAVVPEALSFCFEVITAGTEMEGAKLKMDIVPLMGYCHHCEMGFKIKNFDFVCPTCGDRDIETISGQDLSIVEIEVDEEFL